MTARPITFLGHTLDASRVLCVEPVGYQPIAGSIYRCGFVVIMEGGVKLFIQTEPDGSRRGHAGGPPAEEIEKTAEMAREKFLRLVWPE